MRSATTGRKAKGSTERIMGHRQHRDRKRLNTRHGQHEQCKDDGKNDGERSDNRSEEMART